MTFIQSDWKDAIPKVVPHVVRITTPTAAGTGFYFSIQGNLFGIATAKHLVESALLWNYPLRIHHIHSGSIQFCPPDLRAIFVDPERDSAAVFIPRGQIKFPNSPIRTLEKEKFLRVGNEVGWLGFPAVAKPHLCFFRGIVSCWIEAAHQYLVDGVAINGVSGGPAFMAFGDKPMIFGTLTAYIANRTTGEALPGISVINDLHYIHSVTERLNSLSDAKKREAEAAPASPEVTPQPTLTPHQAPEPDGARSLHDRPEIEPPDGPEPRQDT